MIAILVLVKVSLVVLAAALTVACLGRQSSAASRHLVCTLAICGLLGLPVLSLVLPAWPTISLDLADQAALSSPVVGTPADRTVVLPLRNVATPLAAIPGDLPPGTPSPESSAASGLTARIPWPAFLALIYAGGVGVLVARLAFDQLTVSRLTRRTTSLAAPEWQRLLADCAQQLGVRRRVRLLRSPDGATPLATGVWHHAILVPAVADTWSEEMRRAVLLHELAHVARRDCLTQLAAAFACALYWIHPGAWWLARRLRIERELACDDRVLSAGADAHDYASHLLELACTARWYRAPSLAVGMAAPRQLEARMLALLDSARARTSLTRRGRAAAIAVFVALMVPIAASTAHTASAAAGAALSPPRAQRLISAEFIARLFTVEYWRDTAAQQLARLADQLQYLREMRQLGYSVTDADVIFRLRQHGVTPEYVRALAAEGLSQLSPDDLLNAASHGVSPDFISDLNELGYRSLDLAVLVRMRSHGVDGDFIRGLADGGFSHLSIDELVRAQSHGISPEYIGELRSFGYDLSLDDFAKARAHGLEPHYLEALSSMGYPRLSLDRLVLLLSHGVDASYIRALQALGYVDLAPESLATLRSRGVTHTRVKAANDDAGVHLTVDQLIQRASRGWRQ